MKLLERIFDHVLVLQSSMKMDSRGSMTIGFDHEEIRQYVSDFTLKQQRVYSMPEVGTFFGIHYQDEPYPQSKLISVVQGEGIDYVVDLRKDSVTYKQWKAVDLKGEDGKIIYIPKGYGHAFLSLKENTIQLFAIDQCFVTECSKQINYKDPGIGLELPIKDIILSDCDENAPYLLD